MTRKHALLSANVTMFWILPSFSPLNRKIIHFKVSHFSCKYTFEGLREVYGDINQYFALINENAEAKRWEFLKGVKLCPKLRLIWKN